MFQCTARTARGSAQCTRRRKTRFRPTAIFGLFWGPLGATVLDDGARSRLRVFCLRDLVAFHANFACATGRWVTACGRTGARRGAPIVTRVPFDALAPAAVDAAPVGACGRSALDVVNAMGRGSGSRGEAGARARGAQGATTTQRALRHVTCREGSTLREGSRGANDQT